MKACCCVVRWEGWTRGGERFCKLCGGREGAE